MRGVGNTISEYFSGATGYFLTLFRIISIKELVFSAVSPVLGHLPFPINSATIVSINGC
ncbi:MAG: hypothetical protein R3C26_06315 [Calditrichia bacterium]